MSIIQFVQTNLHTFLAFHFKKLTLNNFIKLKMIIWPVLTYINIYLFKLFIYILHFFKFVNIPTKEKIITKFYVTILGFRV
jgi:hypothetical protein